MDPQQKQQDIVFNTPKNLSEFMGQFVIFFSDEENPAVLFNTPIPEEAYKKAQEIKEKYGKEPIVFRVQEETKDNIAQVLATKI